MNARVELEAYIESNEYSGALLLTGNWGCGKTHLIKTLKEHYKSTKYVLISFSLFGVSSIQELSLNIKQEVLRERFNLSPKTSGAIEKAKGLVAKGVEAVAEHCDIPNALFSINPLDFVSIEKDVIKNKELILVFDDIDRSEMDIGTLLGVINEYVEIKRIKTILVADEKRIENAKYREFKEKVISRTIRLNPDYLDIVKSIISDYRQTKYGYQEYLRNSSGLIHRIFEESKTENLRILKSLLVDFERVHNIVIAYQFDESILEELLVSFSKVLFREKSNREADNSEDVNARKDKTLTERMKISIEEAPIGPIKDWIREGNWNEDEIVQYLKGRYNKEHLSDEWKLLNHAVWELNSSIFENAFPHILQKAYDGDLPFDQLTAFLRRIPYFKRIKVIDETDIDYGLINKGIEERMNKVYTGDVEENETAYFLHEEELEEMDDEAKRIYIHLYKYRKDIIITYRQRRDFINTILTGDIVTIKLIGHRYFVALDEEMVDAIVERYTTSDPATRFYIALAVKDVSFHNKLIEDAETHSNTICSLMRLCDRIKEFNVSANDPFAGLIDEDFIEIIHKKIAEIEDWKNQ